MSLPAYVLLCICVVIVVGLLCMLYVRSTTPLERLSKRDWQITGLLFLPVLVVIVLTLVVG